MSEEQLGGVTEMSAEHHGVPMSFRAHKGCPSVQLSGDSKKRQSFRGEKSPIFFPSTPFVADHLPDSLSTPKQMPPGWERG